VLCQQTTTSIKSTKRMGSRAAWQCWSGRSKRAAAAARLGGGGGVEVDEAGGGRGRWR
jgi:hypothetical protein